VTEHDPSQPTSGWAPQPGWSPQPAGAQQQPYPYGAVPYGAAVPHGANNGMGTAALVLGILAFFGCWTVVGGVLLGGLAVVFGVLGRGRAKRQEADNGALAIWGLSLGAVGIVLGITAGAIYAAAYRGSGFSDFVSCSVAAGDDQAKVDACDQEFQDRLSQ
jgi:Domain of unknown function (DUF4190)